MAATLAPSSGVGASPSSVFGLRLSLRFGFFLLLVSNDHWLRGRRRHIVCVYVLQRGSGPLCNRICHKGEAGQTDSYPLIPTAAPTTSRVSPSLPSGKFPEGTLYWFSPFVFRRCARSRSLSSRPRPMRCYRIDSGLGRSESRIPLIPTAAPTTSRVSPSLPSGKFPEGVCRECPAVIRSCALSLSIASSARGASLLKLLDKSADRSDPSRRDGAGVHERLTICIRECDRHPW